MLSGPKVIRSTVPRKDKARLQAFLNMNGGKTKSFGIWLNMMTLLVVMILIQINLGDNNNNPSAPEKNPTMLRGGLVYSMENKAQKEKLRSFMVINKITSAYAGTQFDEPSLVYRFQKDRWVARITDDWFPMKKVSYGGNWRDWDHP